MYSSQLLTCALSTEASSALLSLIFSLTKNFHVSPFYSHYLLDSCFSFWQVSIRVAVFCLWSCSCFACCSRVSNSILAIVFCQTTWSCTAWSSGISDCIHLAAFCLRTLCHSAHSYRVSFFIHMALFLLKTSSLFTLSCGVFDICLNLCNLLFHFSLLSRIVLLSYSLQYWLPLPLVSFPPLCQLNFSSLLFPLKAFLTFAICLYRAYLLCALLF